MFSYPLHSTLPLRGFPSEHRHPLWKAKIRMAWLPDGEKNSKISLFVLAQLTNVTDGRTDRRTPHSIAPQKLFIKHNMPPVAQWDPRPATCCWMTVKSRRPDQNLSKAKKQVHFNGGFLPNYIPVLYCVLGF